VRAILKVTAIALLRGYRAVISPVLTVIGITCRHTPSCSNYAIEGIERFGFWRGGWLTLARLLRCHPIRWLGGTSGIDNVPKTLQKAPFWAPWRYGNWRGPKT